MWTYRNLSQTLLTELSLEESRRSIYCDAMRYFFHIVGNSKLFPDELGRSVCTENLIRVDEAMESPKLAE
jgi:hypothetical protein